MAVTPVVACCCTCSAALVTFLQDLSWKKPARQWEAVLDALASGRSTQPQGQAQAVPTPVQTPEHVARSEKATALRCGHVPTGNEGNEHNWPTIMTCCQRSVLRSRLWPGAHLHMSWSA